VLALLERRGVIDDRRAPCLSDDGFAEREPALASLAGAAVTGNPPDELEPLAKPVTHRSGYRPWREVHRRPPGAAVARIRAALAQSE